MICPLMQSNVASPCKRDGDGKGSPCGFWDHAREQCSIKTIAGALEGLERVVAALVEFEQLKKILDWTQDKDTLDKLKEYFRKDAEDGE